MVGIISYGAYIPLYRMSRDLLTSVWGMPALRPLPGPGGKAVCNWDEDSITMAVEATIDCINGLDRQLIEGLYFASNTPPYREKQSASIVAAAIDLRREQELFTADFIDSVRAGTSAMRAAIDAVKAGSAKRVMITASDCRLPAP